MVAYPDNRKEKPKMKSEKCKLVMVVPFNGVTRQEGVSEKGVAYANVRVLWGRETVRKIGDKETVVPELHGGTIPCDVWDALIAGNVSAVDKLYVEGILTVPEAGDSDYEESRAHKGEPAREYVSGDFTNLDWTSAELKTPSFGALRPKPFKEYKDLPIYVKKADRKVVSM